MTWMEIAMLVMGFYALIIEIIAVVGRAYGKKWQTISMVMRKDGRQWLLIPCGWGVLGGHFFGPDWWTWEMFKGVNPYAPQASALLICFGVTVLARDLLNRLRPVPVSKAVLFSLFMGSTTIGAFLWPQG